MRGSHSEKGMRLRKDLEELWENSPLSLSCSKAEAGGTGLSPAALQNFRKLETGWFEVSLPRLQKL